MRKQKKSILILIAESDDSLFETLKTALLEERPRGKTFRVKNSDELKTYLWRKDAYSAPKSAPRPNLILINLDQAEIDGLSAIQAIKSSPELRQIPVIALTQVPQLEAVNSAYEAGANSIITRPANLKALTEIVKTLGKYWLEIVELPSGRGR